MCAYDDSNNASAKREAQYFGDVCLLGLGVTGRAVADFFLRHPGCLKSLTIYAGETQNENLTYLRSMPSYVRVFQDKDIVSGKFDVAVVSPGIPPSSDLYQSARNASTEIISEPELAWRISPENWVAVTGTNGKTTVTELITALLQSAGKTAWAAGNIGTPCIEVVGNRQEGDWIIAELSSYQLHSTVNFAPDAAVLLNITPDHLSWHGSHENYRADKLRILKNLSPDNPAVLDATLPETREIADNLALQGRRVIHVGSKEGLTLKSIGRATDIAYVDAATDDLMLKLRNGDMHLIPARKLNIKGPHNLSNALAAAAVAAVLGASADDIDTGLMSFVPLPNRFEPCGVVAGINFVNDSKATNSDAAIKALSSFTDDAMHGSVVAMFGGLDKGTDLSNLVQASLTTCRYVVCYGEAGKRFHAAMAAKLPALYERTFDEAFARAFALALPGDTILLSPACASFDEFDSFEARGDRFKHNISKLKDRYA